jgi:hypothetical protein
MKLTKTQTAMVLKLAGKIKTTPYSCNHENSALDALRSKNLAEYFYYQNNVGTCCGTRLTEAGQKFSELL